MPGITCRVNIWSSGDVALFRESFPFPPADCLVHELFVTRKSFSLTAEDVKRLQNCPLKRLYLQGTLCLSESVWDLSNLTALESLDLDDCDEQSKFTITGLPDSLRKLEIQGLTQTNVALYNPGGVKMEVFLQIILEINGFAR